MKKLEIIIRPENLEELKELLNQTGATGLMITSIKGYGNQKGVTQYYRGTPYTVDMLPKIKVETVVAEELVSDIVDKIKDTVASGQPGDGKIFIYNVEDAIRIRTGESGEKAL